MAMKNSYWCCWLWAGGEEKKQQKEKLREIKKGKRAALANQQQRIWRDKKCGGLGNIL
jgi:hypothetical protein